MTNQSDHRKDTVGAITRIALALTVLALCLLVLVALTACIRRSEPEGPAKTLDFQQDIPLPLGKPVLDVQRVDTDSDKKPEWVLFYRFDQVGTGGPVAALIYDVVNDPISQLPMVYPYKLRTPDQDYLAEDVPHVGLYNVLTEPTGATARNELVFATTHEVAIFRLTRDPDAFAADNSPLYRCIGFFRNDAVAFDPNTFEVTVTSNAGFERSQLVTRSYYQPASSDQFDGYFVASTNTLVPPKESQVDFSEGKIPDAILDTPYPEKIVLAFYQTLGKSNPATDILYYLSSQAADAFKKNTLKYGSPFAPDQLARAIVTELSYIATQDTQVVGHVKAWVVFYSKSNERSNPIEVNWRLVRVDNRWKMDYSGM
jgi:hypothetical protein